MAVPAANAGRLEYHETKANLDRITDLARRRQVNFTKVFQEGINARRRAQA